MRIAQIAPLYESVPPRLYGGTERVVAHLSDALVRRGHDVVLFASGDSTTLAEVVPCRDMALRLDRRLSWDLPAHLSMLAEVRRRADEFDILHFHLECLHFPFFQDLPERTLTTVHGRQDIEDLPKLYQSFPDFPLVSISQSQKKPLPRLRWIRTVHHGYPKTQYAFSAEPKGGYLAFLGRISPEKGVDRAITIADQAGVPLRIAAKIDVADRGYFETHIAPLLKASQNAEYIGEIGEANKAEFLGNASALLFPIDWPEPFGLVMIEAMACGTPVIAFKRGAVPEVIEDGVTGFMVETIEGAAAAVPRAEALDRARIRSTFERRFSADVMAAGYEAAYEVVLNLPAKRCKRPALTLVNGLHASRGATRSTASEKLPRQSRNSNGKSEVHGGGA
jgi:glycosyltransferase involved in cell wall biosynthesis